MSSASAVWARGGELRQTIERQVESVSHDVVFLSDFWKTHAVQCLHRENFMDAFLESKKRDDKPGVDIHHPDAAAAFFQSAFGDGNAAEKSAIAQLR
jgi:hypothetical protein